MIFCLFKIRGHSYIRTYRIVRKMLKQATSQPWGGRTRHFSLSPSFATVEKKRGLDGGMEWTNPENLDGPNQMGSGFLWDRCGSRTTPT